MINAENSEQKKGQQEWHNLLELSLKKMLPMQTIQEGI